jgi:hypothetical protein
MRTTAVDCLSASEARDFQGLMIRKSEEASCQVSNLTKTAADKITFDSTCTASGTTATSELTFGSDWYTAIVKVRTRIEHVDGQREADFLDVHRRGSELEHRA